VIRAYPRRSAAKAITVRRCAIGIDIGGSSAKIALVSGSAHIVARVSVPCDPRAPWRVLLGEVTDAASSLAGGRRLLGVGVGCAGCVDAVKGIVRFSPNLPLWKRVPVAAFIEERLAVRCVLDNDVNMASLAELMHGAARGARNVCCVTVGTGVGGGLIIEGALYRGASMSAGELGHIQVEPEGVPCACGNRGCLERYVGRDGLIRLARSAARRMATSLRRWEPLTPLSIAAAARAGNPAAAEAWERAGRYLGLALVGLVNLLNPDVIVIGGGIAGAGALLLDPARRTVRERALGTPARHVRIVRSTLGADAGVIGAASVVLSPPGALRRRPRVVARSREQRGVVP